MATILTANNKTAVDLIVPLGLSSLVFYKMYTSGKDVKEAGIIALIVAGVSYAITTQVTKNLIEAAADHLSAEKQVQIQQAYGVSGAELAAARQRASSVYHAFFDSSWSEDESAAIAAVNQCANAAEVRLMCDLYQQTYNKSLRADFDKYVHWWDGSINAIVTQNWT